MSAEDFVFQPLDLSQASEDEYICLNKFKNKMNLEYKPDDPPIPLEEQKQGWKNIPSFVEYEAYGEKSMFARGNQRWTMYIVDRANGKTTGLTEVVWNLDRP